MAREAMEFDVVVVGGGVAGLSAAIRIRQMSEETGNDVTVCVLEKGSEIGAHILSGAVVDPIGLDELLPDWRNDDSCPLKIEVSENHHWILHDGGWREMPHQFFPPLMNNKGCYTGSLGNLTRWLGEKAEAMGVEVYPGFAAAEILYRKDGSVKGVATGDMGIAKDGSKKDSYEPGIELHAKYTFFAEGVRGHLSKQLIEKFELDKGKAPQTYAIGIKELWDIPEEQHKPGRVIHTQGWPLEDGTVGGGFIYHQDNNQVAIGFVVALDYKNPYMSPFDEMQRFKTNPAIAAILKGGRRVAYGARAINEGGLQSVPKLVFPGGALIGCAAGFVNVPRIKGSHNAMKSGMLAAEAAFEAVTEKSKEKELSAYAHRIQHSWVWKDLSMVRNARPALSKFGIALGSIYSGTEMWINNIGLGWLVPWSFKLDHKDHAAIENKDKYEPIDYPKPDGVLTFDKLSSVFLSSTNHEEDQPVHLTLKDASVPIKHNLPLYDEPAQRYCPAGVYEVVYDDKGKNPQFQINAQNCVHCKTCDIKDPTQNINWVVPEGGGGPNYPNM